MNTILIKMIFPFLCLSLLSNLVWSGGKHSDIALNEQFAYSVDGFDSLRIYDISDITNPIFVGGYKSQEYVSNIKIWKNYAFTLGKPYEFSDSRLQIFDISNSSSPTLLKQVDSDSGIAIKVSNNRLYLLKESGSINIYELSLGELPKLKSSHFDSLLFHTFLTMHIENDVVFVGGTSKFKILDCTNIDTILEIAQLEGIEISRMAYRNNLLYCHNNWDWSDTTLINVFDVSVLSKPKLITGSPFIFTDITNVKWNREIVLYGNNLIIPGNGLMIIDISNPVFPVFNKSIDIGNTNCNELKIKNGIAFVSAMSKDMLTFDLKQHLPLSTKTLIRNFETKITIQYISKYLEVEFDPNSIFKNISAHVYDGKGIHKHELMKLASKNGSATFSINNFNQIPNLYFLVIKSGNKHITTTKYFNF